METIGERMNFARKQLGLTFNDLAIMIEGVKASALTTAFTRNTIKDYYVNIICEKCSINKEWVTTGKGQPFLNEITKIEVSQVAHEEFMEAKYLPVTAQAGYMTSLDGSNGIELQKLLVPKEFDKGDYLVVEISGPSMDDGTSRSICDGDKLLVKEISLNNGDKLPYRNNLFVIVSKEGLVCKQIISQDSTEGIITCHSFNDAYDDYPIKMKDIYRVFLVRKIVERRVKL